MSGGWWLWHAPESFLQHEIARSMARHSKARKGFEVFTETSPTKIKDEHDKRLRGRPPKMESQRQRFDIVVWQKTSNKVQAIIEIKRGGTSVFGQVAKDAKKLKKYLSMTNAHGNGYLLFYSEAGGSKRLERLKDRISKLTKLLKPKGWRRVQYKIDAKLGDPDENDKLWSWCICLLKYTSVRRPVPKAVRG
jgi:hypothetical protein